MFVDTGGFKKSKAFYLFGIFIIHEGKMWNAILEILEEKVKQGVDVRLIYDDMGRATCCRIAIIRNFRQRELMCGI